MSQLKEYPPYFLRQIQIAFDILDEYQFNEPFHNYLTRKFQQNKNWGSKDRKNYRAICYKILRNYLIFNNIEKPNRVNEFLKLDEIIQKNGAYDSLIELIDSNVSIGQINESFKQQAPVFFVPFQNESNATLINSDGCLGFIPDVPCFIFSGNTNLEPLIKSGTGYIQDYSSTKAISKISPLCNENTVWDVCCASGGKSLSMLRLAKPKLHFCSDVRSSILKNLQDRFDLSPFNSPTTFVWDATNKEHKNIPKLENSSIIIADLPCSGSGNWRRTPENRWMFYPDQLLKFQKLQREIFINLYNHLPQGGYIYYMTCSIFNAENGDNIDYFKLKFPELEIIHKEYYGGELDNYKGIYSDLIFGCLIRKS